MHSFNPSPLDQIKFTLALTIIATASIKPVAARSLESALHVDSSKKNPGGSHSKRFTSQYHHERIPLDSLMEHDIFGVASHLNYAHDESERRLSDDLYMKSLESDSSKRSLDMELSRNSASIPLSMKAAEVLLFENALLLANDSE